MVEREAVASRSLSAAELIAEFERLKPDSGSSVLAFDADGTLWTGDVGEDIFNAALEQDYLREEARHAIEQAARLYDIPIATTLVDTCQAMFAAYLEGRYPERQICEMMTWCYAGHRLSEFQGFVQNTLTKAGLAGRLNRELEPILKWAREHDVRTTVISASPQPIVEQAASLWGFSPSDISASPPRIEAGIIQAELSGPTPYAEAKCVAARKLFGEAAWLASFGDNVFDIEMLLAAGLGVAVRPKLALRTRLTHLPDIILLTQDPSE